MTFIPTNFVVWAEIPVADFDRATAFYETVTGGSVRREMAGPQEIAVLVSDETGPHVSANLYIGEPAAPGTGNIVHLIGQGTAEDMRDRAAAAGATLVGDIFEIPPGRVFLCRDPDGNTVGFFEPRVA